MNVRNETETRPSPVKITEKPTRHKVLFLCAHHSGRSQMAEVFLNKYGGAQFEAESAGLEPGPVNPYVIRVMQEKGIDLTGAQIRDVFDLFRAGRLYNAVITVCDQDSAERCPIFPGSVRRIAWSFKDPTLFTGSEEEVLQQTRVIRDEIEQMVKAFIQQADQIDFWI